MLKINVYVGQNGKKLDLMLSVKTILFCDL